MKTLLLFCLAPMLCFAQLTEGDQEEIDSLKQVIKTAVHDSIIINAWSAWVDIIYRTDPDLDAALNNKIVKRCQEILKNKDISMQEIGFYQESLGNALSNLGAIYEDRGDYIKAMEYRTQSLKIFEELGDKVGIANSLNGIGYTYDSQGDVTKAIQYYTRSLKIFEEIGDKSGIANQLNNIGSIYRSQGDNTKALHYYTQSLKIDEELGDKIGIANSLNNIGSTYENLGDDTKAMEYHVQSLALKEEIGDKLGKVSSFSNIGSLYENQGDVTKALLYYRKGLKIEEELGYKSGEAASLNDIGGLYYQKKDYSSAINYSTKALGIAKETGELRRIKAASQSLYESYKQLGNKGIALEMYETYISSRDSLESISNKKEVIRQQYKYAYEKQALADSIQNVQEQRVVKAELAGQKQRSYFLIGGLALALLFGVFIFNRFRVTRKQKNVIEDQKKLVEVERDKSDHLLLNILPKDTAAELKEKGSVAAQSFPMTSVLFTDFVGFTAISEKMSPEELLEELNYCFSEFDAIMQRNGIEKIKTIGDAYMAASGIPIPNTHHAKDMVKTALEIKRFMLAYAQKKEAEKKAYFKIRIGVHSGPLVAGVVGTKKFQYDIWGDTVNVASRMESNSEPGKVNISETTFQLIKKEAAFTFTSRGEISVKGKGNLAMHFVDA